jgi:RNA polymerase sigma-70 factor (ECF subfamily)
VTDKSEECLVEAAQTGCLESFAALYERHYNSMVALAYSVLADRHLSEDAAQQAFAAACRDLPNLKNRNKFAFWLAAICRNTARQMRRSRARLVALSEATPAEDQDKHDSRAEVVRRAVWKLRATEREPIVLRYYNGLSYEGISAVLGISPQAVHGRLTRARKRIAGHLKREGITGGDYETPRKQ